MRLELPEANPWNRCIQTWDATAMAPSTCNTTSGLRSKESDPGVPPFFDKSATKSGESFGITQKAKKLSQFQNPRPRTARMYLLQKVRG
jgi:hypothetical protein